MQVETKEQPRVFAFLTARIDDEIHVLVVVRSKNVKNAGQYALPGGRVDEGETFEDAMSREIREELGLNFQRGCWSEVPTDGGKRHLMKWNNNTPLSESMDGLDKFNFYHNDEVSAVMWMKPKNIAALPANKIHKSLRLLAKLKPGATLF